MTVKRKLDGAVDESSADQDFCILGTTVHMADEIWARLEFLKPCCRSECSIFRFV